MIYRWHGYGVDAIAVDRPNENNYLFLPGQLVCYLGAIQAGIHLEKDMSVPFGHTVARTVCLFDILCAPKSD